MSKTLFMLPYSKDTDDLADYIVFTAKVIGRELAAGDAICGYCEDPLRLAKEDTIVLCPGWETNWSTGQIIDAALAKSKARKITLEEWQKEQGIEVPATFKREHRYIVFKVKDVETYLAATDRAALDRIGCLLNGCRVANDKETLKTVVVEHDWPEYEPTWAAIEARMRKSSENTN